MTAPAVSTGSFLDTLIQSVTTSVEGDVRTWLIQQYAALQAMPQTLAQLAAVQVQMAGTSGITSNAEWASALSAQGAKLGALQSGYPAMIQAVNTAYAAVQATSGATLAAGADVAIAVAEAQTFTQGVSDVQSALKSIIDSALQSGAITASEALSLENALTSPTSGWLRYVLYLGGAWLAYKLLRKVL